MILTFIGIALAVFAAATRLVPTRLGLTDAITHRPFSSPYQAAPAARDPR